MPVKKVDDPCEKRAKAKDDSSSVELDEKGHPVMLATHLVRKHHFVIRKKNGIPCKKEKRHPGKKGMARKGRPNPCKKGLANRSLQLCGRGMFFLVSVSKAGEEGDLEEAIRFKPKAKKEHEKTSCYKSSCCS